MGGGGGTQRQEVNIPAELRPLYANTANQMVGLQNALPLFGGGTPGAAGAPAMAQFPAGAFQRPGAPSARQQVAAGQPTGTNALGGATVFQNPLQGVAGRVNEGRTVPASEVQLLPWQLPGGAAPNTTGGLDPTRIQPTQTGAPSQQPPAGGGAPGAGLAPGYPQGGFVAPNPLQIAGLSQLQQSARGMVGQVGQRPQAETQALNFLNRAPSVAGQVPGQFNFAAQAPSQAGRAQDLLNTSVNIAGRVPGQFQTAVGMANRLMPLAGQVPGQFAQQTRAAQGLMGIAERMPGGINELINLSGQQQGEFGQASNLALGMIPRAQQVPGQFGDVRQQAIQEFQGIGQGDISNAATIQAAQRAFEENILPQIQNQAALSGLGASTALSRGMGAANAQALLPLIQEEFARQERGVNLAAELGLQEALAGERGIERGLGAGQFATQALQQQGQAGERSLERQLGARQFGTEQERAQIERMLQTGQFGVQTGLEEAAARERGIQRQLETGQFGVQTQLQSAAAQERGIERGVSSRQAAAQGFQNLAQAETARRMALAEAQERGISRQAEAMLASAGQLGQLGQAETARIAQEIGIREALGGVDQQIAQARNEAQQQDFLRRQALAEQALFAPLGGFLPSTLGQTVRTSSGGMLGK